MGIDSLPQVTKDLVSGNSNKATSSIFAGNVHLPEILSNIQVYHVGTTIRVKRLCEIVPQIDQGWSKY